MDRWSGFRKRPSDASGPQNAQSWKCCWHGHGDLTRIIDKDDANRSVWPEPVLLGIDETQEDGHETWGRGG